jgi:hypothetical protein
MVKKIKFAKPKEELDMPLAMPVIENSIEEDTSVISEDSDKMTLYNAYRRNKFSPDPAKNLEIYNKRRRGYEGKEKTVLIRI